MPPRRFRSLLLPIFLGLLTGCGPPTQWSPQVLPEGSPIPSQEDTPYLKAHLHSGELVTFSGWSVPADGDGVLGGYGIRYTVDRVPGIPDMHRVPLDSIALLEANRKETVSAFAYAGLMTWTVISTAVTVACVADPKGCFGSCPTFYLETGTSEELVAEGFSVDSFFK